LKKISEIPLLNELVSKDSASFLILLDINKEVDTLDIVSITNNVLSGDFDHIEELKVVSPKHIEAGIAQSIKSDLVNTSLWILLVFSIVILLFYRSFKAIVYISINMIFTLIPTVFILGLYGYKLNMIIVLIIPIVSILALADSVHILTGFLDSPRQGFKGKLLDTYSKFIVPSFLTSLTTAISFYSLFLNSTKSVAVLGVITGHMVMISFFLCYLISPFLLKALNIESKINFKMVWLTNWLDNHKKYISIALFAIFISAVFLFNSLSYNNDFEIFLPKNSIIKADHDSIKRHFYSQSTVDILLNFDNETENNYIVVEKLAGEFRKLKHVRLVKNAKGLKLLSIFSPADLNEGNRYSKENGKKQLINLKVDNPNSIKSLEKNIIDILKNEKGFEYIISSPALAFEEVNDSVARSLIRSLFVSAFLLFLLFIILTKSLPKGVIGIIVNIVPLSSIVLIFIIFGMDINMLTAITGVVSIGLIVDDTIHAFYRRAVLGYDNLEELGFSMVTTTTVLFVSFISFVFSDFTPTVTFGVISSIVFILALISDLTMLPFLLNLIKRK